MRQEHTHICRLCKAEVTMNQKALNKYGDFWRNICLKCLQQIIDRYMSDNFLSKEFPHTKVN